MQHRKRILIAAAAALIAMPASAEEYDGDSAVGRAYWYEFDVEMPARQPIILAFGHYEDELRKVDGKWLFSKRAIYNVILEGREGPAENPAW